MVNYTLKFKNNLKLKTILPIFWNYSLFTTIFNSLINDPQHIILFSSMQQNKLDKVKKFLFYKLKSLKFKITLKKLLLYKKKNQKCSAVFLSPLFFTKKYSNSKILGPAKFNLMSKNWDINVYALGGLKLNNFKKISLVKCSGIGGISFFEEQRLN